MYTPFSKRNAELSRQSHEIAKQTLYPYLFGTREIEFEYPGGQNDELSMLYDAGMNVDCVAHVSVDGLRAPLTFLMQERFRASNAQGFGDITITEWNPASNTPSELYKMTAGFFVYGITNAERDPRTKQIVNLPTKILEAYITTVPDLYLAICQGRLRYGWGENPRTRQPFMTIRFDDLREQGY